MPKLARGLGLAGGLLLLAACTKRPLPTTTSADGGAAGAGSAVSATVREDGGAGPESRANAPTYAGPFEPHVVGRMLSPQTILVPLADGKVVLQAGLFRYALAADGTASRIGDLASYAAKMPPDDTHLVGYDVEAIAAGEAVAGARPWHDLRGTLAGRTMPERWSLSDDIDVPPNIQGDDLRRAVDGTAVLLTRDTPSDAAERGEAATYVTFVAPPNSRHATRVAIGDPERARRDVVCEHVPSWQRPHLLCHSWRDGVTSVYRLVANRWESVPIAAEQAKHLRVGAVGPDGALWLGLHTGSVMRIAAAGTVDTFDMPRADDALARASYTSGETYARPVIAGKARSDDDSLDGLRRWVQVGVNVGAPPRPITQIRQIVPRSDGEAWVLASESYDAHVLVHMSRPAMAPLAAPLLVGSETDQRNELRNVKEPVTWVAHCPQLFVTLARQRADGSFAADTVWSREKAIGDILRKIVGKASAQAPISMIVEGHLAGRRVAGVLTWRSDPSASEDLVEKAASAVASELSSMTGATPRITCTAPVLERAAPVPL
jgi:hypothetical protein